MRAIVVATFQSSDWVFLGSQFFYLRRERIRRAMALPSPSFHCTLSTPSQRQPIRRRWVGSKPSSASVRLTSCRTHASQSSSSSSGGDRVHELSRGGGARRGGSFPVYVTLPSDAVGPTAENVRRRRATAAAFRALAAAGVEGVVVEVWWGLVERDSPGRYRWRGYLEIVEMARLFGLKVRAVMAFHQCGSGPDDPFWIPLPLWVLEEMDKDSEMAFADKKNPEYISLGCDVLPLLHGRSPVQAYADLMRNFKDTFRSFLGCIVTGIQIGLGPGGELRYPSYKTEQTWTWASGKIGEFQFYDKYMLASFNACAQEMELNESVDHGSAQNLETKLRELLVDWHSKMLLLHGERICSEAASIFRGTEVNLSGKLPALYHRYYAAKESTTSSYYSTMITDRYVPIIRMFGRYNFTVLCSCFEAKDPREHLSVSPYESPENFLKQVFVAARICDVPLEGENYSKEMDDDSFERVLRMSRSYCDGQKAPSFAFNFVRMDKNLFESRNWISFTRFVRRMSDVRMFQSGSELGGGEASFSSGSTSAFTRVILAY